MFGIFRKTMTYEDYGYMSADTMLSTVEATTAYMRAAAADIKNKSKSESFPTLVPLAIGRLTGLKPSDPHWPVVSDILYSLLEVILKTTESTLVGTKKHAKLV